MNRDFWQISKSRGKSAEVAVLRAALKKWQVRLYKNNFSNIFFTRNFWKFLRFLCIEKSKTIFKGTFSIQNGKRNRSVLYVLPDSLVINIYFSRDFSPMCIVKIMGRKFRWKISKMFFQVWNFFTWICSYKSHLKQFWITRVYVTVKSPLKKNYN